MNRKQLLEQLLKQVKAGQAILIVGLDNPKIPDIHSIGTIDGKTGYRDSIKHLGFGFFEGHTEHGKFEFRAGGAMTHHTFEDEPAYPHQRWLSYTPLDVYNAEVLKDLKYDFDAVADGIQEELNKLCEKIPS